MSNKKQQIMKTFSTLGEVLANDLNEKSLTISNDWNINVREEVITFTLLDESGERIFGSEVTVTGFHDLETGAREMKINTGTMGAVDNTCVATVESMTLMVLALNNWEEFSETCEWLMDKSAQNKK